MGHDNVIVAIIMIGMITAFVAGAIVATKAGNQGFARAVKFDTMARLKHNGKSEEADGNKSEDN